MNVISTKFGLEVNYDMVMKDAFQNCRQNYTCGQHVPSENLAINQMSEELMSQEGLSRSEQSQLANDFVDKALYDDSYTELHRKIFKYYDVKLNKNQYTLKEMEKKELEIESKIKTEELNIDRIEEARVYEANKVLLTEAKTNVTDYVTYITPII